ncbi:ankyrin repeat domain-containing protein [Candidatus Dependentiae bacterium]|nr:MAG: ankyrin repeat domain-containing protein [Candidatus Dependentiae bacterium]
MKKINVAIALYTGFTILSVYAPNPSKNFFNAIRSGNIAQVQRELFAGANINTPDKHTITPLGLAVYYRHEPIVHLLIERGANVNAASADGYTPLHTASKKDNLEIVKLLLKKGANVNAETRQGSSPLHCAIEKEKGNTEIIEWLLAYSGIDINTTDIYGWTPLNTATRENKKEEIKLLLTTANIEIDIPNQGGYTPLHVAANNDDAEIIELLLQSGADIFAQDRNEKTPIELTKDNRIKNVFRNYIKNNIHKHIKNKMMKRGFTAFSMARYPHLGEKSPANILPPEIFYYIYKNFLKPSLHK